MSELDLIVRGIETRIDDLKHSLNRRLDTIQEVAEEGRDHARETNGRVTVLEDIEAARQRRQRTVRSMAKWAGRTAGTLFAGGGAYVLLYLLNGAH